MRTSYRFALLQERKEAVKGMVNEKVTSLQRFRSLPGLKYPVTGEQVKAQTCGDVDC